VVGLTKDIIKKSLEVDRSTERYVEAVSRSLWPWGESRLLALVGLLVMLDYLSTFAALELSGNKYLYEGGPLANWALQTAGFAGLFLFNIFIISALLLTALTIRFLHFKFGFEGFGRAAFVVMLVPYVVVTMAAIFNNVLLTFL